MLSPTSSWLVEEVVDNMATTASYVAMLLRGSWRCRQRVRDVMMLRKIYEELVPGFTGVVTEKGHKTVVCGADFIVQQRHSLQLFCARWNCSKLHKQTRLQCHFYCSQSECTRCEIVPMFFVCLWALVSSLHFFCAIYLTETKLLAWLSLSVRSLLQHVQLHASVTWVWCRTSHLQPVCHVIERQWLCAAVGGRW